MSEELNQIALFEDIPQDAVLPEKVKKFRNCISDIFHEIISERNIPLAKVQRDTEIPFPTMDDWIKGKSTPLTDENIMVLARYLEVDLEYLCYGLGSEYSIQVRIKRVADYFQKDPDFIFQVMEGEIVNEGEARAS